MGKHSLVQESRLRGPVRGAIIAGAVAGTAAMPAIPAMAQTIDVPGFGTAEIPEIPQNIKDQIASPQVQSMLRSAPPQVQQVATQVMNQTAHPAASGTFQSAVRHETTAGQRALDAARTKLGTPYVWGGAAPGGFDCSGLVKWAYQQAGVKMPRTSFEQAHVGAPVKLNDLRPGDVVIYNGGNHAALYAGNGRILHASVSGQPVKYAPLHEGRIFTVRRI